MSQRRWLKHLAGVLVVSFAGGIAAAQTAEPPAAANAAEMASTDSPFTFSSRSTMVLVPVVVRDKQGRPIGTLKQDDFQLFDSGKLQLIRRFSLEERSKPRQIAVRPAPEGPLDENRTPLDVPERFIAYLFDDVHLKIEDIMRARQAAERHFKESLPAGTRAAIFTTSGVNGLDFTADRAEISAAMNKITARSRIDAGIRNCPDIDYYLGDQVINRNDQGLLQVLIAETRLCPGNDELPDEQIELLIRAAARHAVNAGEADARLALQTIAEVIGRMSTSPGNRSIVLVSPGFFVTSSLRSEESSTIDRAIRERVTIGALDARGLYTYIAGGDASTSNRVLLPQASAMRAQIGATGANASGNVLGELAYATGGRFFQNSNDLAGGFDSIAAPPEYMYVLGFSPQNLKMDGRYHNLQVKLREGKGLDVQARRGYFEPNHSIDPAEAAVQQVREAVFSLEELQELSLELNTQFFKTGDFTARLTVLARVLPTEFRYQLVDERHKNDVTLVAAVFDQNGTFVTGIEKKIALNLRNQTLERLAGSGTVVRTSLDVPTGNFIVRLVVRDSGGQTMAARNSAVRIP